MSRVPIKGEPDFTSISNERLNGFVELAQQMIFAYKGVSAEKVSVLKEIWKDMSKEQTSRLCASAYKEIDIQEEEEKKPLSVHRIKPVRRIKR